MNIRSLCSVMGFAACLTCSSVQADHERAQCPAVEVAKLVPGDVTTDTFFGEAVAISGDTLAVSARLDDEMGTNAGAVYVFTRRGNDWTLEDKLFSDDIVAGDQFGIALALEGDALVVGATRDDDAGSSSGAAYVFVRESGIWSQQDKLTASDALADDQFGVSVAISGDTVVVGAHRNDFGDFSVVNAGSVYIFEWSGSKWSETEFLLPPEPQESAEFGWSVAIQGNTLAVGEWRATTPAGNESGAVHVYARDNGEWSAQGYLILGLGMAEGLRMGASIALNGDTLIAGNFDHLEPAYVFQRTRETWAPAGDITASDMFQAHEFAHEVAMSGQVAVIGAALDDDVGEDAGSAYVLIKDGSTWRQVTKLFPDDGPGEFGIAVANHGGTVVVSERGAVYVFDVDLAFQPAPELCAQPEWFAQLSDPPGSDGSGFGDVIALSGDLLAVGVPDDDTQGEDAGSVVVATIVDGRLDAVPEMLTASDAKPGDAFGQSIVMQDEEMFVGSNDGAYIYARIDGRWLEQTKIEPAATLQLSGFGRAIAVDGDTLLVGLPFADDPISGAALVYVRQKGEWLEQQMLVPDDGEAHDWFGYAVSIEGDTALIGAYHDNELAPNAGSAYVFTRVSGVWNQSAKLVGSSADESNSFGHSVLIHSGRALIGARRDRQCEQHVGAVYVFEQIGKIWTEVQRVLPWEPVSLGLFGVAFDASDDLLLVDALWHNETGYRDGAVFGFRLERGTYQPVFKLLPPLVEGEVLFGGPMRYDPPNLAVAASGLVIDPSSIGAVLLYNIECSFDENPADLNGDGVVNGFDLALLLGEWTGAASYAPCPPHAPADLNSDCKINGFDLALLLGSWG